MLSIDFKFDATEQELAIPEFVLDEEVIPPTPVGHEKLPFPLKHGQFAIHYRTPEGTHFFARDRLGVNKLFYVVNGFEGFQCSNFWFKLLQSGHSPDSVWSLPSGHCGVLLTGQDIPFIWRHASMQFGESFNISEIDLDGHLSRIRDRLDWVFQHIRRWSTNHPVYVSLSGGLDSTAIAVLAREYLESFTAVSFAVEGSSGGARDYSEDLNTARRVAEDLGVRFMPALLSAREVLECLDVVLIFGQDWREFNVHCALVNAGLGQAIHRDHAASGSPSSPLLLTGDVMNELMADYTPTVYKGKTYYSLPRVRPGVLRRILLGGLDAGDREVGIMSFFGVHTIQPYALCADAFAALPPEMLATPHAKQELAKKLFGHRIPDYVYSRRKTRAQEGSSSSGTGTLAVCADNGVDAEWLKRRFSQLYGIPSSELHRFIRAGQYRFDVRAKGYTHE